MKKQKKGVDTLTYTKQEIQEQIRHAREIQYGDKKIGFALTAGAMLEFNKQFREQD